MQIIYKCQKFSLRVLLSLCLIFCQFQPGAAYKSIAYKKKSVYCLKSNTHFLNLESHRKDKNYSAQKMKFSMKDLSS